MTWVDVVVRVVKNVATIVLILGVWIQEQYVEAILAATVKRGLLCFIDLAVV